jgi:hypothetical protein
MIGAIDEAKKTAPPDKPKAKADPKPTAHPEYSVPAKPKAKAEPPKSEPEPNPEPEVEHAPADTHAS